MTALINFEWERDSAGYRVETRHFRAIEGGLLSTGAHDRDYVVANGGPPTRYRPFDDERSLFAILVKTEPTAEGIKSFAEKFGFLWHTKDGTADPLDWREPIEGMRSVVDALMRGDLQSIANAFNDAQVGDLIIRFGSIHGRNQPVLYFTPPTLLSALWVQAAQHVSGGHSLRQCLHCGTAFVFGSGTGRRRSGHYCSDRCRKAAWIANRKER